MDFVQIKEREAGTQKKPVLEVYPDYKIVRSKDLMIRGKGFHAIWDEGTGLWSTDEFDVQRLVDDLIQHYTTTTTGFMEIHRKLLGNFSSNSWLQFRNYVGHLSDSFQELDNHLTFANTEVKKEDYVSKRLPYPLIEGDYSAWDELVGKLYDPIEREKIEWIIGAIISGEAKRIHKFGVFYGPGGTGKSTIIEIIQKLTQGYYTTFEAAAITGSNNAFSTEVFADNPLVAIQHDGDLSRIQDNSKLNAIVAHEEMVMNHKFKPSYKGRVNAFLIMGTNKPVKITDAKSGLIRRLIDIHPTGELFSSRKYSALMAQIDFELGAIAYHCLQVYRERGKSYYSDYRPVEMMLQTDIFFNFIEAYYDTFEEQDGTTLVQAFDMYKEFIKESDLEHSLPRTKFRDELRNYFETFEERAVLPDGTRVRSWFGGFNADRFKKPKPDEKAFSLVMDDTESLFDTEFQNTPAQYANRQGTPQLYWDDGVRTDANGKEFVPTPDQIVSTTLSDLDTSKEHYVKVPENLIVIDFDLTDADGNKSLERNLEAASKWPPTYSEFSKSGHGVHLHYYYDGAAAELRRLYDDEIEIKVFTGNTSLRRKLTMCNNVPIANFTGSLPLKEKKPVLNEQLVKSEKALRDLLIRNLNKEIHDSTKPSMDFIKKILDDAYASDLTYDVTDMQSKFLTFAQSSTNQKLECIKIYQQLKLKSEDVIDAMPDLPADERLVFFDTEVFENLFVICWKYENDSDAFGRPNIVRMVNPSPAAVTKLMGLKLVGFNCRRYDNHILYARHLGYSNADLYKLSQAIINNHPNALFGAAYNISYVDILDYSSKKQSLKKFEIELGIPHKELGLPWDKPVPKEKVPLVVSYCDNDVMATESVHNARRADYIARQILADLSGLPMNSTTQQHAARIVFGEDKKPQEQFIYTDLSIEFPGYDFGLKQKEVAGRTIHVMESHYRGEITGEGGYVYAEPGMYHDVALLDIVSMHPTTIEQLNMFGEGYTKNFSALKKARVHIKRGEFDEARKMFGGMLARYLTDEDAAEALAYALKIVINIVYGLTSASFDNAFRDPRNVDNIVAKRGALFMIELKLFVQNYVGRKGERFTVAHIKTDSIKIPGATKEIIEAVMEFGEQYGYEFEHEATYEKMCLVNDAVYVAKTLPGKKPAQWVTVGAQFQHRYVRKALFTKEPIEFRDKCEEKHVTSALYLDFMNEDGLENEVPMALDDKDYLDEFHRHFVGKAGLFCPILPDRGGALLMREKAGEFHSATGAKGYRWLEAEVVDALKKEKDIDISYFDGLVDKAKDAIGKFGDIEQFVDA